MPAPRRNKSGTAEVNAPLSLNTETKALSHNLPLFEPVGADTSRPQRRGIEPSVEWILPKVSEFVGGGNLSPRRVPGLSGLSIQLSFVSFRAAGIRPYGLKMFNLVPF